jgi:acyl carrier protein
MVREAISLENEIKEYLVGLLIQENKIDVTQIKLDSLLRDLDVDSFGFLEIIFSIEHQYNINFPKNFEHIKTLQDVVDVTRDLVLAKNTSA